MVALSLGEEIRRTIRTRNTECGTRTRVIRGTEHEALDFARRACEYLRPKGVQSVEAWSCGPPEGEPENLPGLLRFCLKPHRNGRD